MQMQKIVISVLIFVLSLTVSNFAMSIGQQQTEVNEEVITVTAYPDTQKRFVDLNYAIPQVSDILQKSNVRIEQIREQQEKLRNKSPIESEKNRYDVIKSSAADQFQSTSQSSPTSSKEEVENLRLLNIQSALAATLRQSEGSDNFQLNNGQERAEFDYSFAPICEIPRHMNISEWFERNSWNIFFRPLYHQYNVKNVMLRIFKETRENTKSESEECDTDVNQMLTLTISVYTRKRREFKKKMIFSTMIEKSFSGWIEIDAKGTLKYWDQQKNNYGLAVDVYDQDDNQLDAREFFHLQNCEAGPPIPWRAFKLMGSEVSNTVVEQLQRMYTNARLDLTSETPANYDRNSDEEIAPQRRQQRHTRHENHRSSNLHNFKTANINSYITFLKNRAHKLHNSDHLHRDDKVV